ncbi:MAG TPA: imidazole glycerol phosphate synthase subunit HisH [Flavobacteriales bacterium]|nr:imidazole glycerol phosphate synthase subunit HisH [Flavobacteriales bacterium]
MIAIVKYNAGNVRSVQNALHRLGVDAVVTDDPKQLREAEKVIFPGVGEASTAMRYLKERGLDEVLKNLHQPFLGICLGLQLMCKHSEEGDTECLGIFNENVKRFPTSKLKVPHMGWNNCSELKGALFASIDSSDDFYFVHSYYAELGSQTTAQCDYILPFSAALQKDNFHAVQFHPEKSAEIGQQLIKNFLEL